MDTPRVVIVGGGFSGTLLALHLLADPDGPEVALVERSGVFGLGAAYSTRNPEHFLNTRAGNMSAFPDKPDHFLRWLLDRTDDPTIGRMSFVQRMTYGAYIQEMLAEATASGPPSRRLSLVVDDAVSVVPRGQGFTVALAGGDQMHADALALALGNLQPAEPQTKDRRVLASPRYVAEAWRIDLAEKVAPDDAVLLIGTGLTMIDVVVALSAHGHRGPFFALSRRGLVPRPHVEAPPHKLAPPPVSERLSQSLRTLREMSDGDHDWRTVFDGLRPVTKEAWEAMPAKTRRRFLRHARPWWDVHRHRLAPVIARRIDGLLASGQLQIAAGRLIDIRPRGEGFEAAWRPRGESALEVAQADWVVNCVGPHADIKKAGEPILDSLLKGGLARPDPLNLGLEVDRESRLVSAHGSARPDLVAVGPLTRSAFWESTAVPDIRVQVADVAKRLAAHLHRKARPDPGLYQRADI